METPGRRHRAALAVAALLWVVAIPALYFTPFWRWLAASPRALPPLFLGDPRLPYLREAMLAAARALGGAGLLVASAGLLGRAALSALGVRPENRREEIA